MMKPQSTLIRAARFLFLPLFAVSMCLGLVGCKTAAEHGEAADRAVYAILDAKSPAVPGTVGDVNIDPKPLRDLSVYPTDETLYPYLGVEAELEVGAAVLTLEDALEIAFEQNREYQSNKESLYLRALALTLDRHAFAPSRSSNKYAESLASSAQAQREAFEAALATMTGTPGELIQQYSEVLNESGTFRQGGVGATAGVETSVVGADGDTSIEGSGSLGVNMLMRGGARLALSVTSSFTTFLSGGGVDGALSSLSGSFVQPLLRGRGRDVNMEFLTQSERDVLYELRDFTRFRKTFAVRVASTYYSVLQQRETVRNNYTGLRGFELNLERERAFQEVGERTASQVARLEQAKLDADTSWTRSIQTYQESLDNLKILLGFPTDSLIVLDESELAELSDRGLQMPELTSSQAVQLAMVARLDLYTSRDRVDDSERRITVAANDLKGDLDLILTANVPTEGQTNFASFDFEDAVWSAGLDFDLPLDRMAERNNFRRSLIDFEVASRQAALEEDNIKLDVRDAWRRNRQSERDYNTNLLSVELNKRRVEEEELLAEIGEGDINNLVDAQDVLTRSLTALTGALITNTITVLELWRDIGILYVKENGQWEDLLDA